jgi:hypothetical protein
MLPDPPVRADGRCAYCGGERKLPKRPQKGVDPASYERDPFCSSTCARLFHGLETAKPRESMQRAYVAKDRRAA